MGGICIAKAFFYYGTMNSSKTANLLMTKYNYESRGRKVILLKSALDTRHGSNVVTSRVGIGDIANIVIPEHIENIESLVNSIVSFVQQQGADVLMVDEAQFFDPLFVKNLIPAVVDNLSIPILAYGLLKDYTGYLFEGTESWIENADKIVEIKTVCELCSSKATFNFLDRDSNDTGIIHIGDSEYHSFCRKHFLEATRH